MTVPVSEIGPDGSVVAGGGIQLPLHLPRPRTVGVIIRVVVDLQSGGEGNPLGRPLIGNPRVSEPEHPAGQPSGFRNSRIFLILRPAQIAVETVSAELSAAQLQHRVDLRTSHRGAFPGLFVVVSQRRFHFGGPPRAGYLRIAGGIPLCRKHFSPIGSIHQPPCPDLLEISGTANRITAHPRLGQCRKQQRGKNCDNCGNHEQLNKRKFCGCRP